MKTNRFHCGLQGQAGTAQAKEANRAAFTLIELLAVIACAAVLTVTLLPALAGTRQNSQVIGCLANQRQLAMGWMMYARDNNDVLVPNRGQGGTISVNYNGDPRLESQLQPEGQCADWCPGDITKSGCIIPGIYPGGSRYSWWIQAGLLYPYINNYQVYRCPADHSILPRSPGPFTVPALRTYSMNCWVQPMDAPGYGTTVFNGIRGYLAYTKLSEMTRPGPNKTWVFIEEGPYTIDDGFFAVNPASPTAWYNSPAVLHGNASVLAYADGHADAHRWTDSKMTGEKPAVSGGNTDNWPADPNSGDLAWFISVTTAPQ